MENGSDKRIRVLLADNHPIVRAGIRAQLEKISEVEVVGEANDGREAVEMVDSLQPNAVFMDITMPNLNGLEATKRITQKYPKIRVIILSRHENEEYYWGALRSGASGYLLKKAGTAELETALLRVVEGEIYLCREIAVKLRKKFPLEQIAQTKSPLEQLTARQREILQLIAEGQNTKSIGSLLNVSPKTVEYHRARIMRTLGVRSAAELFQFCLD